VIRDDFQILFKLCIKFICFIKSFVKAFRAKCPMGKCLLTIDINGGGTTGPTEMYCDMITKTLPATGEIGKYYKNE